MLEEQPDNPDSIVNEHEEQKKRQKEQVQKILVNVRQNFGKIYVAPEFSKEDLVPVEMPDLDMSEISDSDCKELDEGDNNGEKDDIGAELAAGETKESKSESTDARKTKSSREVIRELDEKIYKYKQFLEQAKSKRFSAIRSVFFNEMSFFFLIILAGYADETYQYGWVQAHLRLLTLLGDDAISLLRTEYQKHFLSTYLKTSRRNKYQQPNKYRRKVLNQCDCHSWTAHRCFCRRKYQMYPSWYCNPIY